MDRSQFDPKEIGMETCPDCNSYGRKDGKVCHRCGGFGFIVIVEDMPAIREPEKRRIGEMENQEEKR